VDPNPQKLPGGQMCRHSKIESKLVLILLLEICAEIAKRALKLGMDPKHRPYLLPLEICFNG
jgi:hypothetical protein